MGRGHHDADPVAGHDRQSFPYSVERVGAALRDQAALPRDERRPVLLVDVVDGRREVRVRRLRLDVDASCAGRPPRASRTATAARSSRSPRPAVPFTATPSLLAFESPSSTYSPALSGTSTARESAGGHCSSARQVPSFVWITSVGSCTDGSMPLEPPLVEAHDLVEEALAAHQQAALLVRRRCRARGPTCRTRPASARRPR